MSEPILIVTVSELQDDGQTHYRVVAPSRALGQMPGVTCVVCDPLHRFLPALQESADVLVLHVFHAELLPLIARRRDQGRATVLEVNDDYSDVQPWNPRSARWLDRSLADQFQRVVAAVDAVQTSSDGLALAYGRLARRVVAFPNQLEAVPDLTDPPAASGRPLTVGWGGSLTHLCDWFQTTPALQRWLEERPDVHLAVMTDERARPFLRLPPERYSFHPPYPLVAYERFLRTLDVGLAPLLPSGFNQARTDLKFLEYAAQGVPGVYADYGPFRDSVRHGETGLLYRTPEEMVAHLDAYVDQPGLRQSVRRAAHRWVMEHRRLDHHAGERLDFYRDLLPVSRTTADLPAAVRAAVGAGGYVRIDRQAPEQVLARVISSPPRWESVAALQEVIKREPEYFAARQTLGALLNELQDYGQAVEQLEEAVRRSPDSLRARAELARARLGLGDRAAARTHFEAALALYPLHPTSWQGLMRLLADDAAESGRWAEPARKVPAGQFLSALAGLRVLEVPEALARAGELLDACRAGLHPEERPYAAAAFSQALGYYAGAADDGPVLVARLQQACDLFPESARLADLLGAALRRYGQPHAADDQFARAAALRRAALTFHFEYPQSNAQEAVWQVAEYVRRLRPAGAS